ncbi:type VII secretion protein EssA [Fictibacillus barbaricus]|uniref:Type VII secretion protein EssA n=1 Tax=Fictibacillus barbaricus TaxID=182136 RepID=A0ABU1U4W2_9BACL|nr:type VII secretion protein EssA [Fictibacillus barbaricus]MDR7074431.1 type VII secretion protein EssA [Fictibacillus barbaricus]
MKHIRLFIVLVFLALFFLDSREVFADKSIQELTPNQYEDKELKGNTEYLLKESLSGKKTRIPEEQQGLTFSHSTMNQLEAVQNQLFEQASNRINNNVSSLTKRMNLFSSDRQDALSERQIEDAENDSFRSISVIYFVLIGVGILLIVILLLPGLSNKAKKENES